MASSLTPHTFVSHPLFSTHQSPTPCSKFPTTSQTLPLGATPADQLKLEASRMPSNVDSVDWVASSLTRRFGLGAGLAWAGFLAFGAVSRQINTGLEVSQERANTRGLEKEEEVVLPNGIRYHEMRVGNGVTPRPEDLVVINLKGIIKDSGEVFMDTFGGSKRSIALVLGSRPYTRGMCDGIEEVLRTMKDGGKRRVIVPSKFGFGQNGADFGSDVQIPPNATLEYIVETENVSFAIA